MTTPNRTTLPPGPHRAIHRGQEPDGGVVCFDHISPAKKRALVLGAATGSATQKLVLLILFEHDGEPVSLATLAEETRLSPRAVQLAIRDLFSVGTLFVLASAMGRQDGNAYQIDYETLVGTRARGAPDPRKPCVGTRATGARVACVRDVNPGSGSTGQSQYKEPPVVPQTPKIGKPAKSRQRFNLADAPPGFQRFWKTYPSSHKPDPHDALTVWHAKDLEAIADEVVASLAKWQISKRWCDGYIKSAPAFLRQEYWTQNPEPADEGNQPGILRRVVTEAEAREMMGLPPL